MKERNYSEAIANAINAYLKEDDWNFSFDEEAGLFRFGLSLKSTIKKINYIIDVKKDEYIVYAISPIGPDEEDKNMMAAVAELVCRINYGLMNGNFELDMRDGEVRFKCFVDCEGITPTKDIVLNSIHCPAAMFKRYASGIVDVILGNATAKDAVERCEKAADNEVRTILSELAGDDGDGVLDAMLARLAEQLGSADDEEQPGAGSVPPELYKTDLFGTEGDED